MSNGEKMTQFLQSNTKASPEEKGRLLKRSINRHCISAKCLLRFLYCACDLSLTSVFFLILWTKKEVFEQLLCDRDVLKERQIQLYLAQRTKIGIIRFGSRIFAQS